MKRPSWPANPFRGDREVPLPLTREEALKICQNVYGESAFATRLPGENIAPCVVGWLTGDKQWEWNHGATWREALVSAGLLPESGHRDD